MKKYKKIEKIIDKLPKSAEGSYTAELFYLIEGVIDISQPKSILEIGFNVGHSAAMWLNLSKANLLAIDICQWKNTIPASKQISKLYPKRFEFINSNSSVIYPKIKDRKFDLVFIDGNHILPGPISDLFMAYALGAPWVFMDDCDYVPVAQSVGLVLDNQYYTVEKEFNYDNLAPGIQEYNKKALLLKKT